MTVIGTSVKVRVSPILRSFLASDVDISVSSVRLLRRRLSGCVFRRRPVGLSFANFRMGHGQWTTDYRRAEGAGVNTSVECDCYYAEDEREQKPAEDLQERGRVMGRVG